MLKSLWEHKLNFMLTVHSVAFKYVYFSHSDSLQMENV